MSDSSRQTATSAGARLRAALTVEQLDTLLDAVAAIRSVWHRVRHGYDQRFDPAAHLRTCDEHLAGNWRYGEPLIAAALARGDFAGADRCAARTVSSLLRFTGAELWRPEEPLYEALLARWRTEFSRRRNLWRDMKGCGCPDC